MAELNSQQNFHISSNSKDLEEFRKAWINEIRNTFKRGVNVTSKTVNYDTKSGCYNDELKNKLVASKNEPTCKEKIKKLEIIKHGIFFNEANSLSKPFDIAERLLQGQKLTRDDIYGQNIDENIHTNTFSPVRKKLKRNVEYKWTLVDQLIADIDEIAEIPFFDTSLPREIGIHIFQYLDIVDLCRCAQVSKSWRNLAEDELLWWRICYQSGFHSDNKMIERINWKNLFQEIVKREYKIKINWKSRVVKQEELENIRGGILNAVSSFKELIFAGYSSGAVCLWDISIVEENSSLIFETEAEVGRNPVTSVVVNESIAVAGYCTGLIKIWSAGNNFKTDKIFYLGETPPVLSLASHGCLVAAAYNSKLFLLSFENSSWTHQELMFNSQITNLKFLNESSIVPKKLIVVTEKSIELVTINKTPTLSSIHTLIASLVTCLDSRDDFLACGLISRTGYSTFQLNLYDVQTCSFVSCLGGHSGPINCINIHQSPANLLVTGCKDKCVRVYDTRAQHPISIIQSHAYGVSAVQMDDWKIVSGGEEGLTCVWDSRMLTKCWETHSRYPVGYLTFDGALMITANIPDSSVLMNEPYETIFHRRQRGSLQVYDFSRDQLSKDVPIICHSSFDEPLGYNYNIILSTPYDNL